MDCNESLMTRRVRLANSLLLTALCMAFSAWATEEQQPIRVIEKPLTKEELRFRALDQNNDRKLSEAEFRADSSLNMEFVSLDSDNDGFLSMSEFVSRPIPPAKQTPTP